MGLSSHRVLPVGLSRALGELKGIGTTVASHLRQKFLSAQPRNAFGNTFWENGSKFSLATGSVDLLKEAFYFAKGFD